MPQLPAENLFGGRLPFGSGSRIFDVLKRNPDMTEHPVHMSDTADITRFVFAGKSTFTLRSKKTGIRFTYRVTEKDEGAIYFVALLNGSDNENDYAYLGFYRGSNYEHGRKS